MIGRALKGLGVGLLVLAGVAGALAVAFYVFASSEFTQCFAHHENSETADRAADTARAAGYEVEVDQRGRRWSLILESGETGEDATEFRQAFSGIVEREGLTLGHPNGGCLEREHFN